MNTWVLILVSIYFNFLILLLLLYRIASSSSFLFLGVTWITHVFSFLDLRLSLAGKRRAG